MEPLAIVEPFDERKDVPTRLLPSDRVLAEPGNASDIRAPKPLLEPLKASRQLLGDTAYDSNDLRAWLNTRKTEASSPTRKTA